MPQSAPPLTAQPDASEPAGALGSNEAADGAEEGASDAPPRLLSANFCARANHEPCHGIVYDLTGVIHAVKVCGCDCHAGKAKQRRRNMW